MTTGSCKHAPPWLRLHSCCQITDGFLKSWMSLMLNTTNDLAKEQLGLTLVKPWSGLESDR